MASGRFTKVCVKRKRINWYVQYSVLRDLFDANLSTIVSLCLFDLSENFKHTYGILFQLNHIYKKNTTKQIKRLERRSKVHSIIPTRTGSSAQNMHAAFCLRLRIILRYLTTSRCNISSTITPDVGRYSGRTFGGGFLDKLDSLFQKLEC